MKTYGFTAQELRWFDPAKFLPADGEEVFISYDQGRTFQTAIYMEAKTSAVQAFAPAGFWPDGLGSPTGDQGGALVQGKGRIGPVLNFNQPFILRSHPLPRPNLWAYRESTGE